MRSVHEEPVEVARSGDTPEQFLLHGRLYAVRAVLARWVEPGGWRWSGPGRVGAGRLIAAARAGGAAATPVIHSVPVELADREALAGRGRRRARAPPRGVRPVSGPGGGRPAGP